MISSDKKLVEGKYIKPYSNRQYYFDNNAVEFVFPDLVKDTIRFSANFQRLQIKEFSFDRVKK